MGAVEFSAVVWIMIAVVAGVTVLLCLGVLAIGLEYENGRRKLRQGVQEAVRRNAQLLGAPPAPLGVGSEASAEPPTRAAA